MLRHILFLTLLLSCQAFAFQCEEPVSFSNYEFYQCYVDGALVNPLATEPHPVAFIRDVNCNGDCDIVVRLAGYSATPYNCTNNSFSHPNTVVVKPCPGHWPSQSLYPTLYGWWGYFVDESNTLRLDASIDKAEQFGGNRSKGVRMNGTSYGGGGVLLQSMLLDDIRFVRADVPNTLFVKNFVPNAEEAWSGFERSVVDFRINADKNVFYRINGSPLDTSVTFDLEVFDVCDEQKLACFGTWHEYGHNPCINGVTPDYCYWDRPGPDSLVSTDKPLVAFTNSTANQDGVNGHHNLGLEWNWHQMDNDTVPIRYRPQQGQPSNVKVDVTVRGVDITQGLASWSFGTQHGYSFTTDGEVTANGLRMQSSSAYSNLEIAGVSGC